jgi:hypothetical protein
VHVLCLLTYQSQVLELQLFKKIEKDLYKLIWSDFQDLLLSKESKGQKSINNMLYFCRKEEE